MKNYTVHLLLVCVLAAAKGCLPANKTEKVFPVFEVDLRTGAHTNLPQGVTWHSKLTRGSGNCSCDRQGVLKLNFSPANERVRVQMNLTFEHSTSWTFNVGGSSSNNGYSGDGHYLYNAEMHSISNKIFIWGRDKAGSGSYGLLYSAANFVAINPYTTITLNAAHELATADNGVSFAYVNSHKMYNLNGNANRDLYLAMNRVVGTTYRSGTGLCKVRVQFYSTSL